MLSSQAIANQAQQFTDEQIVLRPECVAMQDCRLEKGHRLLHLLHQLVRCCSGNRQQLCKPELSVFVLPYFSLKLAHVTSYELFHIGPIAMYAMNLDS